MKTYSGLINELPEHCIFVFGANVEGRHGAGAAKVAYDKFGAVYGNVGWQGQSYGIVTKDLRKKVHPSVSKHNIKIQIIGLYYDAVRNPEKDFYVAYSDTGTNLNYYTPLEMAEMFAYPIMIPENIVFEKGFASLIEDIQEKKYYEDV